MKIITSLLVGAHFRPPAKQVLECLPSGARLLLVPEPENPYDENALQVRVDVGEAVPEGQLDLLSGKLEGTGFDLNELLAGEPIQLGYVAKSGGGPLVKAGLSTGNAEFLAKLRGEDGEFVEYECTLAFHADGKPMVQLSTPDEAEE